jgi:hypothetical protein
MSNPLIDKYFELYPEKKEEPKEVECELPVDFKTKLKELRDTSDILVTTPLGTAPLNSNNYISTRNASTSFKTYDPDSGNDSFLQIAEKVKNKDARVTSVTLNRDAVGGLSTGLTTITFEVHVWDTP